MTDWQPIETAPENVIILVYRELDQDEPYTIDSFRWRVTIEEEIQSETRNAKGRRKVVQEIEKREREWAHGGWGGTHWMPLPEPPPRS